MFDRLRALHALILSIARRLTWIPPRLARTSVGLVFVTTGWGKLQDLDRVIGFFRSLGIPGRELQAPFALLAWLAVAGAGAVSLDAMIVRRLRW